MRLRIGKCVRPALSVAAFAVVVLSLGCTKRAPPDEALSSFNVTIDFERSADPGNPAATCSFAAGTDLCPGGPADLDDPIDFNGDTWAQVYIDIQAMSNLGNPWPVTGPVEISLHSGTVFGQSRQAILQDGVVEDFLVRFKRTPGATYIWVQDTLPRFNDEDGPPQYAAGLTAVPLIFDQPIIADIQRTDDECCNPMQGQRVDVTSGEIYVTSIVGNGFNVQDVNTPEWGGMFVFAFNGIQGLRTGAKLLGLGGAVTEFQSGTQMTEPIYTPVNGICGAPGAVTEGAETGEENEQGAARARCPRGAECVVADDGVERCQPDQDETLDEFGRKTCTSDNACPDGTYCQTIEGQGQFCQVRPYKMPAVAFPTAPYCGPINTQFEADPDGTLTIEKYEGSLVRLEGEGTLGVRLTGLPVCRSPGGDDPLRAVRSTCNTSNDDGTPVTEVDCTIAQPGDTILRDDRGLPCFRGNQACRKEFAEQTSLDVRSTCNDDPSLGRCELADPGDEVLTDDGGIICRNTLDDFITSGFQSFSQSKVYFEDGSGQTRCATVNFTGLTGFEPIDVQEEGTRYRSITGTLRQIRFRSASSFWMIDVRYAEDLEPLDP